MQRRSWILLALGVYLVALVTLLPASVVLRAIPLPRGSALGHVTGTLWQGHVDSLAVAGLEVRDLAFEFQPLALLQARIAYRLNSAVDGPVVVKGVVWVSPRRFGGEGVTVQLAAQSVANLIALPLPVNAAGSVRLDVAAGKSGKPWCDTLNGSLSWEDAVIHNRMMRAPLSMGPYHVALSCNDQGEILAHITDPGPLGLQGDVRLVADRGYHLNLDIQPAPSVPADIREGLAFFGEPKGNGYVVELQGNL